MLGQRSMQTPRNTKLKLTGIVFQVIRLMNCDSFFKRRRYPFPFSIFCIGNGRLYSLAAGDASRQLRKRNYIAALVAVFYCI